MNKVIFTIFAGRKRYMEILLRYVDKLLINNIITEVHIWNFTRNKEDNEYIIKLCRDTKYKYLKPPTEIIGNSKWVPYYKYYSQTTDFNDDDIIIKCDDDIVYIDVDNMKKFIDEIKDDKLYYPNMINNDPCVYIQQLNGVHNLLESHKISVNLDNKLQSFPITKIAENTNIAQDLHRLFLDNPNIFKLNIPNVEFIGRVSINMFACKMERAKIIFKNYVDSQTIKKHNANKKSFKLVMVNEDDSKITKTNTYEISGPGDEAYISGITSNNTGIPNIIVPYFNIVHFSYMQQGHNSLDNKYLLEYDKLSKI